MKPGAPAARLPTLRRYVALGDSQTEGLHDYDAEGTPRGWADRFAERVAERAPGLCYANLAVRGKRTAEIRAAQLEPALALEPDLATVMSGVNDVIRPGADVDAVAGDLEAMYASLAATGCVVMACTYPFPTVGLTRRIGPRLRALNALIRDLADRHGVLLVELESVPMAADLRLWSPDRVHLNPQGHTRLAMAFAATLAGEAPDAWQTPLPPAPPPGAIRAAAGEGSWVLRYLVPKLWRSLRGRSSGDGRTAKRPELVRVGGGLRDLGRTRGESHEFAGG